MSSATRMFILFVWMVGVEGNGKYMNRHGIYKTPHKQDEADRWSRLAAQPCGF